MSEEVWIVIGGGTTGEAVTAGRKLGGWEEVSITLRDEAFPNSFAIGASERDGVAFEPGAHARVLIGNDAVITGYLDRVVNTGSPASHSLTLVGRGKTEDLVDGSADYGTSTIENATAAEVAERFAAAYGIEVRMAEGIDPGARVDQLLLDLTAPAEATIQRVARNVGLLAYEDREGALVLARTGARTAASGAVYGQNVENFSVERSMDERFREVVCVSLSQELFVGVEPLAGEVSPYYFTATDANVPRHRRLVIVEESAADDPRAFTEGKARWEVARRAGRATTVQVTVDAWRDAAGALWEPNTRVPVRLPGIPDATEPMILSEVTFHRSSERGTVADLVLMPPAAFEVEPIVLVPGNLKGIDTVTPDDAQ